MTPEERLSNLEDEVKRLQDLVEACLTMCSDTERRYLEFMAIAQDIKRAVDEFLRRNQG